LPLHTYRQAGESIPKPCAEVIVSDRAAARIEAQGIMPLLSVLERDRVQLASFRSLAQSDAPLAGRWRNR
jgi:predicted component of type VI protein secretion system